MLDQEVSEVRHLKWDREYSFMGNLMMEANKRHQLHMFFVEGGDWDIVTKIEL